MRVFSHTLKRANSKNYVRSGKTFQFPAFRAQLQLSVSNNLKVIGIDPYSPVQPLILNHVILQYLVVYIFTRHWAPKTTKTASGLESP